MKKKECEDTIRHLCHVWRSESGNDSTPEAKLSFEQFYSWLREKHSAYLTFRTTTSVRFDVEMWFDQVFRITWMR